MIDDVKIQYCRLLLLRSDLMDNHYAYLNGFKDVIGLGKTIKNNILNLYLLKDALKCLSSYVRSEELVTKRRELLSYLEFMNHLRNIISGHLNSAVIANAIQWQPALFTDETKDDYNYQLNVFYMGLLESAINSYINTDGSHKVFKGEIDVNYPPNQKELFDYLEKVNTLALELIDDIVQVIKPDIRFITSQHELFQLAFEAGNTDFEIKKKKR